MKKPKYVLTFGVPGGSCSTIIFNSAAQAAEVACAINLMQHDMQEKEDERWMKDYQPKQPSLSNVKDWLLDSRRTSIGIVGPRRHINLSRELNTFWR